MAINEEKVTGRKFRKLVDEAQKLWQRISFWTAACDVEFEDGKSLEEKFNSLVDVKSGISFRFGIDEDGNYGYIKEGADTVIPFSSGGIDKDALLEALQYSGLDIDESSSIEEILEKLREAFPELEINIVSASESNTMCFRFSGDYINNGDHSIYSNRYDGNSFSGNKNGTLTVKLSSNVDATVKVIVTVDSGLFNICGNSREERTNYTLTVGTKQVSGYCYYNVNDSGHVTSKVAAISPSEYTVKFVDGSATLSIPVIWNVNGGEGIYAGTQGYVHFKFERV